MASSASDLPLYSRLNFQEEHPHSMPTYHVYQLHPSKKKKKKILNSLQKNKTKQNKTKQNQTKHNKTKQNRKTKKKNKKKLS